MGSPSLSSKRFTILDSDGPKEEDAPPPPPPPPPPLSTILGPLDEPLSATEMSLAQIRASAAVLAGLLDESKDEQVLKETCLGLCQLFGEGIQNDRIQSILEADVVPRLVELLRPIEGKNGTISFRIPLSIQSAALQVIGNIACGDDRQTQVIIDANALPCLKSLLSSGERGIRKECCWIVSNITESAHQVQDVVEAGILPPLIRLLESGDAACREDATWVLYNVTANRDVPQIQYLADNNGIRALCGLLACTKELDVLWKGCGTVSAVALKGIRNILVIGEDSLKHDRIRNRFAASVAEAHGVERVEMLTSHRSSDVRQRAQTILRAFFGSEGPTMSCSRDSPNASGTGCSPLCSQNGTLKGSCEDCECPSLSTESASSDTDVDEEDSDLELIPPSPPECQCVLCLDTSPLPDKRSRSPSEPAPPQEEICEFCSAKSQIGNTKAGLASKMGRAVRMGHTHCLALVLATMSWSQRGAATDIPAPLNPAVKGPVGGGTPDPALTTTLPAVVLAAQLGKPGCLQILLSKCQPELDQTHGKKRLTPLAWAANKGNLRCCAILLKKGASAGARCADGWTALHLAASGAGSTAVCRLLLDYLAPVNSLSAKNQTPLCLAAQKGHSKVVRLLLDNGADVRNEDDQKFTPLHLAALQGHEDITKALIDAGSLIDARTANGVTALHYAVQGRHLPCVTLLLGAGAKVDGNSPGNSLLLIAADDGEPECVRALLNASAPPDCRANIRVQINKDYEVMDYLAPLHLAASKGHREVVELLIENGAPVNDRSNKGWSALDFAVLNGHSSCALVLLGCGAIVDERAKVCGRGGWTLVQHAAHSGSRDLVRLLISRLKEQEISGLSLENGHALKRENVVGNDVEPSGHAHSFSETSKASSQGSSRRKREVRDFEKDSQKDRDERRRELEAVEAKDRLQEAMSQRSAAKLVDSIAQVNKIILQQATGAGGNSGKSTPPRDIAAELHLGIEVEKARKLLSAVQFDQRRAREIRIAAAADAKRDAARKLLFDACLSTLQGGDPRAITKCRTRAKKSGLDSSDSIFERVNFVEDMVRKAELLAVDLCSAEKTRSLAGLRRCKELLTRCREDLVEYGEGLLDRVLGQSCSSRIEDIDSLVDVLAREEEEKESAAKKAKQYEVELLAELRESLASNSLRRIEIALEKASEDQTSSEVTAELQSARKAFTKACKVERKKIRQAAASTDIAVVESAVREAMQLNLNSLGADVEALQSSLEVLRRRVDAMDKVTRGKATKDIALLSEARSILIELGMFSEAEQARNVIDSLQRQARLRNLLEDALKEANETLSKCRGTDDDRLLQEWTWPDAKKLADLIRRAESIGGGHLNEHLEHAKEAAVQYSDLGRRVLMCACKANDSRTIASAIEAYKKAFMLENGKVALLGFNVSLSNTNLAEASRRLADVQAREQKSVLAESEMLLDRTLAERRSRDADAESQLPGNTTYNDPEKQLAGEGEGSEEASCFHYYLWKEGSIVQCAKCGSRRVSENPEWLDRVKRRGANDVISKESLTVKKHAIPENSFSTRREPSGSQRSSTGSRGSDSFSNGIGSGPHVQSNFGGMGQGAVHRTSQTVLRPSVGDMRSRLQVGPDAGMFSIPVNPVNSLNGDVPSRFPQEPSGSDVTVESFANENFGFDIDSIVNDSGK